MKQIIMWTTILSLFGCGQKNNGQAVAQDNPKASKPEKYVSMDCQAGDITLTLNPDQTFDLTILLWDKATRQHTAQESVKGNWTKADKVLTLTTADKNVIKYELTATNMKIGNNELKSRIYAFKFNGKKFFATGFNLSDQEESDKFLLNAVKQK